MFDRQGAIYSRCYVADPEILQPRYNSALTRTINRFHGAVTPHLSFNHLIICAPLSAGRLALNFLACKNSPTRACFKS